MFGFPPILDGNAGIKFTRDADSGFPKPGIREIFYSVRDGDWTNSNVWETASGRVGRTPGANDDVYIRHTIGGTFNASVNNLFITPIGTLNGQGTLTVLNGLQSYGVFNYCPNFANQSSGFVRLAGNNNYIDKTKQTPTYIQYVRNGTQAIIDANYTVLALGAATTVNEKYLTCDLTVGAFDCANQEQADSRITYLNFKNFNFTCNGIFQTVGSNISFHVEGNQTLIFKGPTSFNGGIYCLNNPTFEFQNGATIATGTNVPNWNTPYGTTNSYLGTGLVRFTTNSQTLSGGFVSLTLDNTIEIADNITLTVIYPTTAGAGTSLNLTGTINGLGANSRLTNGLNSVLRFSTATAATTAMSTGLFDFTTNANTIQYSGNYSATIPSYFNTFRNLTIRGTGTKTLSANTTINGNLYNGSTFELSTFDLTVTGTTSLNTDSIAPAALLRKSGAGNIVFGGFLNCFNIGASGGFDMSGNPNIEFKAGCQFIVPSANFNSGTGTWSFTTNSQSITGSPFNSNTINATISIVGNITVTNAFINISAGGFVMNSTINGTTAGSTFVNNGILLLNNSTMPMSTGVFTISTTTGTIGLIFNGNFTIPYTAFFNLIISGTGTKTLSGNTTVNGNFNINQGYGTGTFECSTFDISMGSINSSGTAGNVPTFSKNGAGNIIIGGGTLFAFSTMNLTGNPTVEVRGSLTTYISINTGTGQWSFNTNDSTLTIGVITATFNCPILVSGANRVLTLSALGVGATYVFTNRINGDSAGSTLRMGTNSPTLNYQNTTQPMATGVLDTSTNLNTFIYGAGNQDVKGGTPQQYRNLRFSGSGTTKTLQGNINVQNTYTVDAGVTVNLNGFTKTPP